MSDPIPFVKYVDLGSARVHGAVVYVSDSTSAKNGLYRADGHDWVQVFAEDGSKQVALTPATVPLTTPDVQDVIDALVTLGLVTQSD